MSGGRGPTTARPPPKGGIVGYPLESLAALWERKLVDIESIDDRFGDLAQRAAAHPEIRAYIREQQKEDPDFYTAFQNMAEKIAKLNPGS